MMIVKSCRGPVLLLNNTCLGGLDGEGGCGAGLLNRLTAASEPGKQSQKVYYGDTSHGEKNGNNGIIKRETGTF